MWPARPGAWDPFCLSGTTGTGTAEELRAWQLACDSVFIISDNDVRVYDMGVRQTGTRMELRRARTAVLMSDTHGPLPLPASTSALHYSSLAALVNAHYACANGYDFMFLQLVEDGCVGPQGTRRHPSYCKLAAIAAAMRRWSTVIFVDSDSWFAPDAPPLEAMLHAARDGDSGGGAAGPSLSLAWDWPYSNGPNCGFMVWRNSTRAQRLLTTWWHLSTGYDMMHDFEQRAMYWGVAHLEAFRDAIETLQLTPLATDAAQAGSPILHVDHTRRAARYYGLSAAILAIGATIKGHQGPIEGVATSSPALGNETSDVGLCEMMLESCLRSAALPLP